jgi:hypothetical protein
MLKGRDGVALSLQFVAEGERHVSRQQRLVASLRERGQPSAEAEVDLARLETMLRRLRNHLEMMRELTSFRY